jgi:HAD superfamily hydrolase (TIGR01509 family)
MPQGFSLALFDAVLFDVDGTLVDSLEMIIPGLADTFEKYAGVRPSDEELQATIGLPLCVQLRRYQETPPSDELLREMTEYTMARYEFYSDREAVFGPAIETLRLCKHMGLGTALVTSKNSQELADFLKRFPGTDSVDVTVCASDVTHPKPAPDAALLALSKLNVSPDRAVFIGDSIYDMQCARAAEIASVAVGYGSATQLALCEEHPNLYIESPDALLEWAQKSFPNRNAPQESTNRRNLDTDSDDRSEGAA